MEAYSKAEDPQLVLAGLRSVGYRLVDTGDGLEVGGRDLVTQASLNLGNNGTGVRFLLAHLAGLPGRWCLDGAPRMRERPVGPMVEALLTMGADVEPGSDDHDHDGAAPWRLPLIVRGRSLAGGEVVLDSSASSQFLSGLMLLGAGLPRGLTVRVPSPPPSRPYLSLTAEVLAAFGSRMTIADDWCGFSVHGGRLAATSFTVEGDWSAAAFPLAGVAVAGGDIKVGNLSRHSCQGDAVFASWLSEAGCRVEDTVDGVRVTGPARRPLVADLRDVPDLFPALAVVVSVLGGRLTGLAGLAAKESDRLAVMTERLQALGFAADRGRDWFAAPGERSHCGAPGVPLDPAADHRVAMALAVAGLVVPGVVIGDPGCVDKSWPGFWTAWDRLTGHPP